MAKGRKLTSSSTELLLGSFGYDLANGTANAASELREEEVWSTVDDTVNGDDRSADGDWRARASHGSFGGYGSHRPPQRTDQPRQPEVGGLSQAFDESSNASPARIVHQFRPQDGVAESPRGRHMATSAPVNVPDWSKIYRVHSVESLHDLDDDWNDNESELVPPHVYLAREYARSRKMAANSVFEGVGRTLKGRDLSRVRDAVWSQTGFNG